MTQELASLSTLFLDARTHNVWSDRPVEDATLRRLYETARMGPTSANSQPMRILFVKSLEAKERLRPVLAAANVDKTMTAPVTALVAYDSAFHAKMATLFPARPEMGAAFAAMPEDRREFLLLQNASMQAAYFIVVARALGLDCGPMGGFDRPKADEAFFGASSAAAPGMASWRSILLINLGHGVPEKLFPRNPRLDFDEACRIE